MSLAVRIIPCLDVRGGRVVKGINFKDIVDAGDPAEAAKRYDAEGADEICMLDIDASFEERSTTIETVKSIASQVFIPFTVGGGIKSLKDIDMLLKSGADKVDAIEWAKKGQDLGAGEILMTSMDKDGTKSGFDNDLYMQLSNNLSIPVIASGGAGELSHLVDAVKLGKADALLAASIFHYEEISIKRVKQALQTEGFEVRL